MTVIFSWSNRTRQPDSYQPADQIANQTIFAPVQQPLQLTATLASSEPVTMRIVGGVAAPVRAYPFTVRIHACPAALHPLLHLLKKKTALATI
jgi:hypothetical protein